MNGSWIPSFNRVANGPRALQALPNEYRLGHAPALRNAWLCARAVGHAVKRCLLIVLTTMCSAVDVAAQDDPAAAQAELKYKRELVPIDALEELARQHGYMTMERAKFERVMQRLETQPDELVRAGISHGVYRAKLDRNQLVQGTAELDIAHTSQGPVSLNLAPCGLAIGQPTWQQGDPRDATIALAADGSSVLIVDRAEMLSCPWSLKGRIERDGIVVFDIRLPPCPDNELILELPEDMIPQASDGVVQLLPTGPEEEDQTWSILLGGTSRTTLRIVPQEVLDKRQQLVLLRESLFYDFAPGVVRVTAELRLDIFHEPLDKLKIQLEPHAQFISAMVGNRELDFTEQDEGTYELTLLEPLIGVDRIVRVTALAEFDTGKNWQLPRVHVADAVWQQGRSELFVPEILSIEQLTTEDCAQVGFRVLPNPTPGESFFLRLFNEKAAATVRLADQSPRLVARTGTTIRLDEVNMTATFIADLRSQQGARFLLSSPLPSDWTVETVTASILASTPEEAGGEVPVSWTTAIESSQPILQVRLPQAIRVGRSIRLKVELKRTRPPEGTELTIAGFRLLALDQVKPQRQLISVIPQPPMRLDWSGVVDLERLPAGDPANSDLELVTTSGRGLSFVDGESAEHLAGTLRVEPENFSGKNVTQVSVKGNQLIESYQIRCEPRSSLVPEVRIHLSQSRNEEIQWTLEGADRRDFFARRLSREEELRKGIRVESGETWQVTLRRHRNVPFVIRGERVSAVENGKTLSLPWLPDAVKQTANLFIHSLDGTPISVNHPGLDPFPVESAGGNRYSTLRAALHYVPENHPRVEVAVNRQSEQSLAWVWNCSVVSRCGRDGVVHQITYLVENVGRRQVVLQLPQGVTLQQLLVNDRVIERDRGSVRLVVPLSENDRFPKIQVIVSDSQALPGVLGKFTALLPEIDVPVFEKQWTIWLPDGYEPVSGGLAETAWPPPPSPWERLLGPLYARQSKPFRIESAEDWRAAANVFAGDSAAEQRALQLLQSLGHSIQELRQRTTAGGITWRQVLLHQLGSTAATGLRMDTLALAQSGIAPDALVGDFQSEEQPWQVLSRRNLVLIAHENTLVLTTSDVRAHLKKLLNSTSRNEVFTLAPEGEVAGSPAMEMIERSSSVLDWCGQPNPIPLAWKPFTTADFAAVPDAGWTAFRVNPADDEMQLAVYRVSVIQAFAWGLFFFTAAAVWWRASKRPAFLFPVGAFAGMAALVVPDWCVPLANAAFLGVLLATVLVLVSRRVPRVRSEPSARPQTVEASTAAVAVLLVGGVVCASRCWADDAETPRREYYPVLIGMDEQQQPAGDLVYLPRDFHVEILKRDERLGTVPKNWMTTAADYECIFPEEVGGDPVPAEFTAKFNIDVAKAGRISLPLSRKNLLPQRSELDSQPAQLEWSQDEMHVAFDIQQPGRHQLKVAFRPAVKPNGDRVELKVSIPRLLNSRLTVRGPQAASVSTPTASGASHFDADAETLTVDLGPAGELVLDWPAAGGVDEQEKKLAVSQLLRMKVDPGAVAIDGKFVFYLPQNRDVRQVDLLVDPRLQVRIPADQPVRIKDQRADAGVNKVTLEFDRANVSSVTFGASFSLYGNSAVESSGIGTLRLPHVEAVADTTLRRWLAVAIDPALQLTQFEDAGLEPMEVAEFLEQWGDLPEPQQRPQLALRVPDDEVPWTFATRRRDAQMSVEQQTDIRVGIDELKLQHRAGLQIAGQVFQLQLQVPSDFSVEQISLRENGVDRVRRWNRLDATKWNVTLDGPVSGNQQLLVAGRQAVPGNHRVRLPQISIGGARVLSSRFQLTRDPSVSEAAIVRPTGLREVEPSPDARTLSGMDRRVAVLEVTQPESDTQATATLHLSENNARAKYTALTTVFRKGGIWYADFQCDVTPLQGVIDEVRFDIPAYWDQLVDLDRDVQLQPIEVPGQSRRILVIPASSTRDKLQIRIRGRLTGQPISAPDVLPIDFQQLGIVKDEVELYVALPTEQEGQNVEWDTPGLEAAPLPETLASAVESPDAQASFRAEDAFQAKVREVRTSRRPPQVRLADIHVAWNQDGSTFGLAQFDVQPNGNETCVLEVPQDVRIVQVTIDGRPALLSRHESGWQVALGLHRLPQRIAVVFQGICEIQNGKRIFAVPSISHAPAAQTLWTIHHPIASKHALAFREATVEQVDLQTRRLQSVAAIVEAASDSALEASQPEINAWFGAWAHRFAYAWQQIQTQDGQEVQSERPKTQLLRTAEKLKTVDQIAARSDLVSVVDAWSARSSATRSTTYHAAGSKSTFEMPAGTPAGDSILLRIGRAAVFLCVLGALALALKRGPLVEWMLRWPYACGVLFGLAWWLWLAPSGLGLAIAGVSIIASFRGHGVTLREPAS